MAEIRVGYHTLTWGRENFLKAVDEISEVGFKGFETSAKFADEYSPEEFKELTAKRNLELAALYSGCTLTDPRKAKEEIEKNAALARFVKAAGGERLVLGGGLRDGDIEEDFKVMARTMNEIGRRCLDSGVKACYHPHLGTRVENREEISRIMDLTDPKYLFLCPDTAHLLKGGSDPEEVFAAYISRIAYVHFKDAGTGEVPADRKIGPTEILSIFAELGEGTVNFPGVLEVMKTGGYSGWVMLELDASGRKPKESAEISRRYVEEVLGLVV